MSLSSRKYTGKKKPEGKNLREKPEKTQPKITGFINQQQQTSENVIKTGLPAASPKLKPGVTIKGEPVLDLKAFLSQKKLERENRVAQKRRASASPSSTVQNSAGNSCGKKQNNNQLWDKLPDKG